MQEKVPQVKTEISGIDSKGSRETRTHLPHGLCPSAFAAPAQPPQPTSPQHTTSKAPPPHQRTSPRPPQPPAKTENHSRKLAAIRKRGRQSRPTT
ncbi:PREDICTED: vitelline membrane protein 15a-3-like [Charadrius vociferus]|uniref:vitelline membrane protein 15a-3-like n=1 Tax=Charadrius vociferus TaxID=50402 RepID=UPI000521B2E9|nr:PREDICTED: vitelline membrane protein 15a-3-like [Charadrius vociferus]